MFFLDECFPTFCLNGGSCSPQDMRSPQDMSCDCGGTGYTGQFCEIRRLWMVEVALLMTTLNILTGQVFIIICMSEWRLVLNQGSAWRHV